MRKNQYSLDKYMDKWISEKEYQVTNGLISREHYLKQLNLYDTCFELYDTGHLEKIPKYRTY